MEKSASVRPRRRVETRAQLIAAAAELFTERGTTHVSVEAICERAGFTRGAFYSNFKTVDELFFALYKQRYAEVQQQLETIVPQALLPADAPHDLHAVVAAVLEALPSDPQWSAVRAGFVAQAQHRAELAAELRAHAEAFSRHLQPLLLRGLDIVGRRLSTTPEIFTRAVLAADAGAITLAPLHDDARHVREAAVRGVILGLTTEVGTPPSGDDAGR